MMSLVDRWVALGCSLPDAERRARLFGQARRALEARRNPGSAARAYQVPGRIEVLGKHTDYVGGRSLVCATAQGVAAVAAPRSDERLVVVDASTGDVRRLSIRPDEASMPGDWGNYPATVARRLAADFPRDWRGADLAFASDLPIAAGLSSSSALVVAVALALIDLNGLRHDAVFRSVLSGPEALAGYLGALENGRSFAGLDAGSGVGTMGGSQDQAAILCARAGQLLRIAFEPVRVEDAVPLPDGLEFAIAASGVVAEKTGAALDRYNTVARLTTEIWLLVREVADHAPTLGASLDRLPNAASIFRERIASAVNDTAHRARLLDRLDQLDLESRVLVPGATDALARGDLSGFGAVVARSQDAAERGLGNQVPETIELVRAARELGAIAASAFGAGFGGSVWALVTDGQRDPFLERWRAAYLRLFPRHAGAAAFLTTRPAPPACRLPANL